MKIKKNIVLASLTALGMTSSLSAVTVGDPSGSLEFKSTVAPACGITVGVNDGTGEINFGGNTNASNAKFTVYSNSIEGAANVEFGDITPSTNITNQGGFFKINDGDNKLWTANFIVPVISGEEQIVSANVPTVANEIEAGAASVTTTIAVSCQ